jgi:hypothetical protein
MSQRQCLQGVLGAVAALFVLASAGTGAAVWRYKRKRPSAASPSCDPEIDPPAMAELSSTANACPITRGDNPVTILTPNADTGNHRGHVLTPQSASLHRAFHDTSNQTPTVDLCPEGATFAQVQTFWRAASSSSSSLPSTSLNRQSTLSENLSLLSHSSDLSQLRTVVSTEDVQHSHMGANVEHLCSEPSDGLKHSPIHTGDMEHSDDSGRLSAELEAPYTPTYSPTTPTCSSPECTDNMHMLETLRVDEPAVSAAFACAPEDTVADVVAEAALQAGGGQRVGSLSWLNSPSSSKPSQSRLVAVRSTWGAHKQEGQSIVEATAGRASLHPPRSLSCSALAGMLCSVHLDAAALELAADPETADARDADSVGLDQAVSTVTEKNDRDVPLQGAMVERDGGWGDATRCHSTGEHPHPQRRARSFNALDPSVLQQALVASATMNPLRDMCAAESDKIQELMRDVSDAGRSRDGSGDELDDPGSPSYCSFPSVACALGFSALAREVA